MNVLPYTEIEIIFDNASEKDAVQPVKVRPDVTLGELLKSALASFSDQLSGSSNYVFVDERQPRTPLEETTTIEALSSKGATRLILKDEKDIPRKIPCLTILSEGAQHNKKFPLRENAETTIGREHTMIEVPDRFMSRSSAVITNRNGGIFLTRVTERKIVFIDGQECPRNEEILLKQGMEILIGKTRFRVEIEFEDIITQG